MIGLQLVGLDRGRTEAQQGKISASSSDTECILHVGIALKQGGAAAAGFEWLVRSFALLSQQHSKEVVIDTCTHIHTHLSPTPLNSCLCCVVVFVATPRRPSPAACTS